MNYIDAIANMKAGSRIKRMGWSGVYLVILPDQDYVWHVVGGTKSPNVNASIFCPSINDIISDDWIVINN